MITTRFLSSARSPFRTRAILWFISLGMIGATAQTTHAQTYNATSEFALTQGGTTGVWTYGHSTSDADDTFNLFTQGATGSGCGVANEAWTSPAVEAELPVIARYLGAQTVNCGGAIPPEALVMHPGSHGAANPGKRPMLRWTAPAAGTYQVTGAFQRADRGATTDLRILRNTGELLFAADVNTTLQKPFDFPVTVAAGDTLDFSLGMGNGNYYGDATNLVVTIGEPVTACGLAPANLQVFLPGENSTDDVQSGNVKGSLMGDATYAAGKVEQSFKFSGNGYVVVPDNAAQKPANQLTVEGWFLTNAIGSGIPHLISKPLKNFYYNSYALFYYQGSIHVAYYDISGNWVYYGTGFAPALGVWTHYAMVLNTDDTGPSANTLKLYVNGVEVISGPANNPVFYNGINDTLTPHPLLIGGELENNVPQWQFNGQADEVSIYGRALTQPEIFTIVQQGSYGKCAPTSCTPPGLVSWYQGEDNTLDAVGGNHGTLKNGASYALGKVGQAFSLNGADQYVLVADPVPASLQIQNEITLDAWIYVTAYPTGDLGMIVGSQRDGTTSGASIFLDGRTNPDGQSAAPGHIHFQIGDGSWHVTNAQTAVPLNQWVHVAATRKANEDGKIYYNGVLQPSTSVPWSGSISYASAWFAIGQQKDMNRAFNGSIDEVGVYNRALSPSDIYSIYEAGSAGRCNTPPPGSSCVLPPSGLTAWLPGDANTNDISGKNNHGTAMGGLSYVYGKNGPGFSLNGTSAYVSVPDSPTLRSANVTVDGWFYFATAPGGSSHLVAKAAGTGGSNSYVLWFPYGTMYAGVGDANDLDYFDTGFRPAAGNWYHIAFTFDASTRLHTVYVNGAVVGSRVSNRAIGYDNHALLIGADSNYESVGYFFNGVADEVEVFDRALAESEIQDIYAAQRFGKCKPAGQGYSISGRITDTNGNGIGGLGVSLGGTFSNTVATRSDGSYAFTNLPAGGNYTITPTSGLYTYSSPGYTFNNLSADQTANLTATPYPAGTPVSLTVTNAADSGPGSLRQAILEANSHQGTDNIVFNIPEGGVRTISLQSGLPPITDAVIIDGYTQPGASANTLAVGNNAVLLIELNGQGVPADANAGGLTIIAGSSTVRGLVINGFYGRSGIRLQAGGNNVIQGNFIGTTANGDSYAGNTTGVLIYHSAGNLIGGTSFAARNVIASNRDVQVHLLTDGAGPSTSAANNRIQGNYFGTDKNGTAALGGYHGVLIQSTSTDAGGGATGTLIGGSDAGAGNLMSGHYYGVYLQLNGVLSATVQGNLIGPDATGAASFGGIGYEAIHSTLNNGATLNVSSNVISAFGGYGIYLSGDKDKNSHAIVQANCIGTTADCATPLHRYSYYGRPYNGADNIRIDNSNNIIGAETPDGEGGNIITNSANHGILVYDGTRNRFYGNSIYDNGGLGIDVTVPNGYNYISGDGVTPNDPGDADTGTNNLQNYPVIESATSTSAATRITGTLNSTANTNFNLQFYSNTTCDPTTYGEGRDLVGSTTVTTDGNGNATFDVSFPTVVQTDMIMAATATNATTGDTSEFSKCSIVNGPPSGQPATFTVSNTNNDGPGSLRAAISFSNIHSGKDTISFNIPPTDPNCSAATNVCTITPASSLPLIIDPVTIDGYTQPGASRNTLAQGDNAVLRIELNGQLLPNPYPYVYANGLEIACGNSEVYGLAITRCAAAGIKLRDQGGNTVAGNRVGTDAAGTAAFGNSAGVLIRDSTGSNTIGGTTAAARNLISGNSNGIWVDTYSCPACSNSHNIQGNYIGTNAQGTAALANNTGIVIYNGGVSAAIGGETDIPGQGAGNLISGNNYEGITIGANGGNGGSIVQGNLIGTDASGTAAVRNNRGIYIGAGANNLIGGTTARARNVISGNNGAGINITGGLGHRVAGNYIGVKSTYDGTASADNALGNGSTVYSDGGDGIYIGYAANCIIGAETPGGPGGNVIAFSYSKGIVLTTGDGAANPPHGVGNRIFGNSIFSNGRETAPGWETRMVGIDLSPINYYDGLYNGDGATANDDGDADNGSNRLQNFPVLLSATTLATTRLTAVTGQLNSRPNRQYTIEFFSNAACDGSGYGEGRTAVGTTTATTDANGRALFSAEFTVPQGELVLAATATDTNPNDGTYDTSEFSACYTSTLTIPPVANDDSYSTNEDTTLNAAAPGVLSNDTDPENGDAAPPTAVLITGPQHAHGAQGGSFTFNPDGSFSYRSDLNYNGTDTFQYQAKNAAGAGSTVATVTITISPVNDAPVAPNDGYGTDEDTKLTVSAADGVLRNDSDVEADALTARQTSDPQHGTLTFRADGSFDYMPSGDYYGQDSFTYRAVDSNNADSNEATVFINVYPVNDAPVNQVPGAQTSDEDNALVFSASNGNQISVSDVDAGDNAVRVDVAVTSGTFALASAPAGLAITGDRTASVTMTGKLADINTALDGSSYVPSANYNSSSNLTITTNDQGHYGSGGALSDTDTVAITVPAVNDLPSFTKGANQTVLEDSGAHSVTGWASNITPGPANEAEQAVSFIVSNDNSALFSAPPAVSSDGTLTYTPAADANGAATVTVQVQDNGGTDNGGQDTSAPQTFTITVTPVNDAPRFTKGADQTVPEDSGVHTVTGWATNITPGPANEAGEAVTFIVSNDNAALFSSQPTISPNGTLTYTPAANVNGSATITVRLQDNGGTTNGGIDTSAAATVSFTVTEVNDVAVANADSLLPVAEDSSPRVISFAEMLANDSTGPANESAQTLTVSSVSAAVGGTVAIDGTNVIFTPARDFNGAAGFAYTAQDNGTTAGANDAQTSAPATVSFTITEVNDAPIASNDTLSPVAEDSGARTISLASLLTNDVTGPANESSESLTVTEVSGAVGGTVAISGSNAVFTPTADFNGPASFTYKVRDNGTTTGEADPLTSTPGTVSFTITEVNDAPTANSDSLEAMAEDSGARNIPFSALIGNDSRGPENESGQVLTVSSVSNAVGGTATIGDGAIFFLPDPDFNGSASFSYVVQDNGTTNGGNEFLTSAAATVSFIVTEVNDPPVATNDALTSITEDSGARTIPFAALLANDGTGAANENDQTLTVATVSDAVGGTVTISGTDVIFAPAADYNGAASFLYTVRDNGTTGGVSDPRSQPATVSFTVTEVNDVPIAGNDPLSAVAEDSGQRAIAIADLLANDVAGPTNENGQTVTLVSVSSAVGGTVAISGSDVLFTPDADFNGAASFAYTVQDNGTTAGANDFLVSAPATVSFTVTAINDLPTAANDALSAMLEDAGARSIAFSDLTSNDSTGPANESDQTLTVHSVSDAVGGTATIGNGAIFFMPDPNFNGTASFSYIVRDNGTTNGGNDFRTSAPASVSFTVAAVNDAPTFSLAASPAAINEDAGAQSIDNFATNFRAGPASATDEASQTLVGYNVTVTETTGSLVFSSAPAISNAGQLAYAVAANTSGSATITVTATDSGSGTAPDVNTSAPQTITITVHPVNDAPSFTNGGNLTINGEAGAQSVPAFASAISAGPADEAGQTVAFTTTNDNNALFTVQPTIASNGALIYTPADTKAGTAVVSIVLKDDGGTAFGGQDTSAMQTFTITVVDTTAPVLSGMPSDITAEAVGPDGAAVDYTSPTAVDKVSGEVAVSCAPASGSTFVLGTTTVTCSATDGAGNRASDTFNITVRDTTPPEISTVPQNIIAEATSAAGAAVTFTNPTAQDIVSGTVTVSCTPASGSTFALGVTTVTCSASDAAGNTSNRTFTVTVRDTAAPAISNVPADITAEATGPNGAVVNYTNPTATDLVDPEATITCVPASGSAFALGEATVTCTARDASNNSSTAEFKVTVRDTIAPAMTVPDDLIVEATAADGATVTYTATATDVVSGEVAVTCTPASGAKFALGTATVTCTAADAAGNAASDSFTVTVRDTTAPVISNVPEDMTVEATSASGAPVTYTAPTANDSVSGDVVVSCSPASGSTFALGASTVTCSAADAAGNTATSSFKITVQDTTAPEIINVPADITAEATSASGAAVTFANPTAQDAVSGTVPVSCVPPSGSNFALGISVVTCSASDLAGNKATKTFNVTVQDTTAPTISNTPANITAEATSAAGAAVIYTNPTASDVVDSEPTIACAPASGSTFALGTATVTCTAQDEAGNISTSTFTVTVQDKTAPAITAPDEVVAEATAADGATVSFVTSATDAVTPNVAVTCTPASGTKFALGSTTVTCSATDAAGNTATDSFAVIVRDTTGPTITGVPADMTIEATSASGATATYTAPTAEDAVSGAATVTCTPASGSTFAVGTTLVTCSAKDAANNASTATFNVLVRDTTAPVFANVPANVTAEATGPEGAAVTYSNPTATDAVDASVTVTCTPASGSTFALGSTTVTCTAQDKAANQATATFSVTVRDTKAPTFSSTPANINAEATGPDGAAVSYTKPSADDAIGATVTCTPASGSKFGLGNTTVTCTAQDAAGNQATTTFTVSVVDTTAPVITAPADMVVYNDVGQDGAFVTFTVTASDAVDAAIKPMLSHASGSFFPIGTTEVTATATDTKGNQAAPKKFKITVRETEMANISTRAAVGTGENVLIGGFIITGTEPLKVVVRAVGPSMTANGVAGALQDPTLELFRPDGTSQFNDNWGDTQSAELTTSGVAPTDPRESAVIATLEPGAYTAVIRGAGDTTGLALVEAYALSGTSTSNLANISTRGTVQAGENVLIGGLIVLGKEPTPVVIRAIGPSLAAAGISGALEDPALELRDSNGELLVSNNDWRDAQQAQIEATGLAPTDPRESAILTTLPAGNYTAIISGRNGATGVALVEIYNLK